MATIVTLTSSFGIWALVYFSFPWLVTNNDAQFYYIQYLFFIWSALANANQPINISLKWNIFLATDNVKVPKDQYQWHATMWKGMFLSFCWDVMNILLRSYSYPMSIPKKLSWLYLKLCYKRLQLPIFKVKVRN